MSSESHNKRPFRPLKSVAGRAKSARPKAGRYVLKELYICLDTRFPRQQDNLKSMSQGRDLLWFGITKQGEEKF